MFENTVMNAVIVFSVLIQHNTLALAAGFQKNYAAYQAGFNDNNPDGIYWIGLDQLSELTATGLYKLRIELVASDNAEYYEECETFQVDGTNGYKMTVGDCTGTAGKYYLGDSIGTNDKQFYAPENDNSYGCGAASGCGWWWPSYYCDGFGLNAQGTHFYWWIDSANAQADLLESHMLLLAK